VTLRALGYFTDGVLSKLPASVQLGAATGVRLGGASCGYRLRLGNSRRACPTSPSVLWFWRF